MLQDFAIAQGYFHKGVFVIQSIGTYIVLCA